MSLLTTILFWSTAWIVILVVFVRVGAWLHDCDERAQENFNKHMREEAE